MANGVLGRYWKAYGEFRALFRSPFFYLAWVLTGAMYGTWSEPGWWDGVISVLPNVLGFSLGGYAIWLAVGDEKFRSMMSGEREPDEISPFMMVNASFVHFIFLQILGIIIALLGQSLNHPWNPDIWLVSCLAGIGVSSHALKLIGSAIGYWVFLYALLAAAAATLAILRVSSWYDKEQTRRWAEGKHKDDKNG